MGQTKDKSSVTFPPAAMVNIFRSEAQPAGVPVSTTKVRLFTKRPGPNLKWKNEESDVWRFEENLKITLAPLMKFPAPPASAPPKMVISRRQYGVTKNMESTQFWKEGYGSYGPFPMETRPRTDVSSDERHAREEKLDHAQRVAEVSQRRHDAAELARWEAMLQNWDNRTVKIAQAKKLDSIKPASSVPYDPINHKPLLTTAGEAYTAKLNRSVERVTARARSLYLKNNSHDPIRGVDVRPPSPKQDTAKQWITTNIGVVPAGRVTDGGSSSVTDYKRHY